LRNGWRFANTAPVVIARTNFQQSRATFQAQVNLALLEAITRYWGLVPEKYIYGKAFFRYWKPQDMGFLEHGHYQNVPDPPLKDLRAEDQ